MLLVLESGGDIQEEVHRLPCLNPAIFTPSIFTLVKPLAGFSGSFFLGGDSEEKKGKLNFPAYIGYL